MGNTGVKDAFELTLTMPRPPVATKAKVLDTTEQSALKPELSTEEQNWTQQPASPPRDDCSEDVDWEIITDYLSRCQSIESADSANAALTVDPPALRLQRTLPRPKNSNPYQPNRNLLSRRNPATPPPSMSKDPSNIEPQAHPAPPTPSPTSQAGLSTGAKAGIVSAAAVGIVIILVGIVAIHSRQRQKKWKYARTKSRDGASAELGGHFTVTTWPDRGEASPMMVGDRELRMCEGMGGDFGGSGALISPGLSTGGHTPLMNNSEFNVSALSQNHFEPTPNPSRQGNGRLSNLPSNHTRLGQTYQSPLISSNNRSPNPEEDPFQKHNRRSRPSHPLAQLSEAIPPPPLEARTRNSMADYQNAVPLGFANGFVQVDRASARDSMDSAHSNTAAERQGGQSEASRHIVSGDGPDGPDGDPNLPAYVETEGTRERPREKAEVRHRETVRYDTSTGHYHIDSETEGTMERPREKAEVRQRETVRYDTSTGHYHIDSESEDERGAGSSRTRRRSLTKEEMG